MNTLSDAELVRRVPGDPAAYEQLYLRHVARVRRFAARRCATPDDVADAVADTFLAILRAAPRYDPRRGEVLPWMLGIAATTIAGERRRLARRRALERRVSGRALLDADDRERIESEIDAALLAPRLAAALAGAPPRERELFLLVSQEGLGVSEAGRALGISAPAARARMARARRRAPGESYRMDYTWIAGAEAGPDVFRPEPQAGSRQVPAPPIPGPSGAPEG